MVFFRTSVDQASSVMDSYEIVHDFMKQFTSLEILADIDC